MIQLKNVTKIYGGGRNAVVALDDVSIDFGSKGLVVILGKSGCGKSTLLNILGGLDKPTMGELTVNGRSARSFSSGDYDAYRNTYVGMVFQEFNLIEEITVYQNIEITLKLQERNTDVNTVDEVLKAVGLANLGYRKPSELSGGQRQRVSLARALLKNPQILLADEPTGALDVSTSEEVFEVLKKLAAGQLVVVVTHDRELAFSYGERIIEIVDGRVVSDKMPESEGYSPVKSLSKNVLEVAAGGSITPDEVNQKVAGGTPNYIGISHDRDRIALAYPETFDSFYLPKDRMRLKDTDPSAIKDDGRPFVLRRSALRLADTFKMARVNRKRTKKRFWFIAILNMVCFSLFAVSTMLSAIKLPNVIAKSAFDPYSQSPVGVAKLENRYGGTYYRETDELSEADFRTIESMLGGKKAHKTYTADIYPHYCRSENTVSGDQIDMAAALFGAGRMDLTLNAYSGAVEGESLGDLGLKTVKNGGKDRCETTKEIILSDFAAQKLLLRGFFGRDRAGRYGSFYPAEMAELVGMSLKLLNADGTYTIAGIFETDYTRYAYLHAPEERLNANASVTLTNWDNNKDFLYTKLFVKTGFVTENFDVSAGTLFLNVYGGGGAYNGLPIEPDKAVYNAQDFENPKGASKNAFIWVDPNASEAHTMPDKTVQSFPRVTENRVVVSRELIAYFAPELAGLIGLLETGVSISIPERLLWFETYGDGNGYRVGFGFQIVGIYDEANFEDVGSFAADSRIIQEITQMLSAQKAVRFNKVMFDRGGNFGAIERLAESLIAKDFLLYSSVGSTSDLLYIRDVFDTVSDVFLYISLGIAVFSFLMMLNYMSSSVRFRAKEIAVYRVVGAGRFDIIKIFLTEGTLLAVVSTILASLLAGVFAWIMDISFSASANIFNLSFTIISFNLLTVLAVFGAIALLVTLSSLIPVVSITRKKAIDALKVIG